MTILILRDGFQKRAAEHQIGAIVCLCRSQAQGNENHQPEIRTKILNSFCLSSIMAALIGHMETELPLATPLNFLRWVTIGGRSGRGTDGQ